MGQLERFVISLPALQRNNREEKEEHNSLLPTSIQETSLNFRSKRRGKCTLKAIAIIAVFLLLVVLMTDRRKALLECDSAHSSITALKCHHEAGKRKLNMLLSRQSRSVDQAVMKYRMKYGREPPQGFAHWVEYALANQAPVIDDYDQLEADLEPLRHVSASVLKERVRAGKNQGSVRLAEIKNGTIVVGNDEFGPIPKRALATIALIEPIAQFLPDMQWLMNWADRHAVLGQKNEDRENRDAILSRIPGDDAGSILTSQCPKNNLARTSISKDRPSLDVCQESANSAYIREHGIFHTAADAFNTTLPVISVGKFSVYEDILAPWCYAQDGYLIHKDDIIPSFQEKKATLYWRGGLNGLAPIGMNNWQYNHRARVLLRLAQMQENLGDGGKVSHKSGIQSQLRSVGYNISTLTGKQTAELSRLSQSNFDVGRSRGNLFRDKDLQNHPDITSLVESLIGRVPENDRSAAFENRFLLDMDGSAVSCRYYRLMGSGGVVFKQTQWAEWHDDRLIPYVHYVPIDLDANQVPAFMDMMINTEAGNSIAQSIGDEAKRWVSTGLRKIDLTVLYYRLLLELAQIYQE